jgi:hypothetical protein
MSCEPGEGERLWEQVSFGNLFPIQIGSLSYVSHRPSPLLHKALRVILFMTHLGALYLLKIYNNSVRDLLTDANKWSRGAFQYELEYLSRALEQSFRWVLNNCNLHYSFSTDSWTNIDDEAFSLMQWARSYSKLCNDHIAASRGFYITSCDEDTCEIRFEFKAIDDLTVVTSQMASWSFHTDNFLSNVPELELQNIFEAYKNNVDFANLDKGFSFNHDLSDVNYHALRNWSRQSILPELEDTENLDGFTLGQIRDL